MILDSLRIAMQLTFAQRSQWWSAEKIRQYQEQKLIETLRYAVNSVDHYKSLGIDATDINSTVDLQRFPVLTKQVMQCRHQALIADGISLETCETSTTSGSTGEPTTTAFDKDTWLFCKYTLKIRRLLAHGVGIGKRVLLVSEMHPNEIAASAKIRGAGLLFGQEYLSIHNPVPTILPVFQNYPPHALYAYPSYLAELLEYCERQQQILPEISRIFTSSEVLSDGLRQRLEATFGASVCDVYGSTEFKEVAWQCCEGRYHVNFESTWVEIIDEADDGIGTVLLTTLINRAMPLIRYRVGDRVRLGQGECPCGRNGPWLAAIGGREVDMLIFSNGRRLSPYLLTSIVELDPAIRRYQLIQESPSLLEIRYISPDQDTPDVAALTCSLGEVLGEPMDIRYQRVPSLPRTAQGKQKVFMRKFDVAEKPNA